MKELVIETDRNNFPDAKASSQLLIQGRKNILPIKKNLN